MPSRRQARRPRQRTDTAAAVTRSTPYADLPQYLTVDELCVVLHLGRSTVYDMIQRGDLPVRRFGRVIRIAKTALHDRGIFPEC